MWDTYIVSDASERRKRVRELLTRYQFERDIEFDLTNMTFSSKVPSFAEVALFILDADNIPALDKMAAEIRQNARKSEIILSVKRPEDLFALKMAPLSPVGISPWEPAYEDVRRTYDALNLIDHSLDEFYLISAKGKSIRIHLGEILFFESRNKKTFLATKAKEYEIPNTLDKLTAEMHKMFLRVHRGYLVNKHAIHAFEAGTCMITLTNGVRLPVSRTYKGIVREEIEYT